MRKVKFLSEGETKGVAHSLNSEVRSVHSDVRSLHSEVRSLDREVSLIAYCWISKFDPILRDSAVLFSRYLDDVVREIKKNNIYGCFFVAIFIERIYLYQNKIIVNK